LPAYLVVVRDTMKDPAAYAAYQAKAGPTLAGHPARVLAANGALTSLEGACPDGVILIEFPDVAAAEAWYHGPEYQAAIGQRLAATTGRAVIVEGLAPA